jgi:hypothetical protein
MEILYMYGQIFFVKGGICFKLKLKKMLKFVAQRNLSP